MRKHMRISKGGQISIPAPIRHRWGTQAVTVDDQGDRLVIEPAPEDPIDALAGSLAEYFEDVDMRKVFDDYKREAAEIEDEKLRRLYGVEPDRES